MYERIYGTTPEDAWVAIDAALASSVRAALLRAGRNVAADGVWDAELEEALAAWAFDASLDGRWSGGDRIDPVVLEHLLSCAPA